jgi:hypothetical protein
VLNVCKDNVLVVALMLVQAHLRAVSTEVSSAEIVWTDADLLSARVLHGWDIDAPS